ncbi:MAG: molybdopterin-guanine dinucleotide biosynthesis protein B [Planctomycetaceae bacterium]|nr:molybdopterin-guanine dinucleotide biosynthesis protein B [Planctomycetaceae bacterium]
MTPRQPAAQTETGRTSPPRIHVVGRRNSGKTTFVCELVRYFRNQGLRVATVKHTHHHHELDTPGKDSYLHREAGATAVGILSPQMTALFVPEKRDDRGTDRYVRFEQAFSDCDLIIVEGDLHTQAVRVEVWRREASEEPYAVTEHGISAVITDDSVTVPECEIWQRSDISRAGQKICQLLGVNQQPETPTTTSSPG